MDDVEVGVVVGVADATAGVDNGADVEAVADGVDDAVGVVDDEDVSTDGKSGISISEIILFILFCLSNSLFIAVFDLSSFLLNSANSAFKFSISFRTNSCGVGVVIEATGLEDEVGVDVEADDVVVADDVDDGVEVVDPDGEVGAGVEVADVDVDGNCVDDGVGTSLAAVWSFLSNSVNLVFKSSIFFLNNSSLSFGVAVDVDNTGADATAGVDDGVDVEADDDGVVGVDVEVSGFEDEAGVDVEADDGVVADVDVDGNGADPDVDIEVDTVGNDAGVSILSTFLLNSLILSFNFFNFSSVIVSDSFKDSFNLSAISIFFAFNSSNLFSLSSFSFTSFNCLSSNLISSSSSFILSRFFLFWFINAIVASSSSFLCASIFVLNWLTSCFNLSSLVFLSS